MFLDKQVNIAAMPNSAVFPELDKNEEYRCHFTAASYSFSLPLVGGQSCDASASPVPSFTLSQIGKFRLVIHDNTCTPCVHKK